MKHYLSFLSLLSLFLLCLISPSSEGQFAKHSRVLELEKALSKEGLEILKGRFPDKPFLITVKIDPLHREKASSSSIRGEKLPYMDMNEEEIIDEWDDPAISNSSLVARVRKIQVNISVPSKLSDDEISELKQSLIYNLGLIEARDAVEVYKRAWQNEKDLNEEERNKSWYKTLSLYLLSFFIIMLGLYFLSWYFSNRIGRVLHEGMVHSKSGGGGSSTHVTATLNSDNNNSGNSGNNKGSGLGGGDLRMSDPIKNREIMVAGVNILQNHKGFPSLEDMLILHKFAEDYPQELGALLNEFPFSLRKEMFSYSYGNKWLEALIDPSDVTPHCLDVLNKLLRLQRNHINKDWENLLIAVWRLDDKKKQFFHGMHQMDAFAILSALPKSIAIEAARESFPGSWAVLLDPTYAPKPPIEKDIQEYYQKVLKIEPLRDLESLDKYKNEKDLLAFLKVADPTAEKEIYQASGQDSVLFQIRPPFYSIFDADSKVYSILVPQVRIEDWALVMFNVGRGERRAIEKQFSEKQRFRYFELLKSFDANNPSKFKVGDARESIARLLVKTLKEMQIRKEVEKEQNQIKELENSRSKDEKDDDKGRANAA